MYTAWNNHLPKDKKHEFHINVSAAQPVIRRTRDLLKKKLEASRKEMLSTDGYSNAAWPYRQADLLGEQRAYNTILDLINNIIIEE